MAKAALIVRAAGKPDAVFEIVSAETLIGRAPTCGLQLADESISREHSVVLADGGTYLLEDLQSTNGIKVNGKRVRSTELDHGDEIEIGQTRLIFRRDPHPTTRDVTAQIVELMEHRCAARCADVDGVRAGVRDASSVKRERRDRAVDRGEIGDRCGVCNVRRRRR